MPECPKLETLRERLTLALAEDLGRAGDVTTRAIFPAEHRSRARIVAKADGVLAGGPVVQAVFGLHDPCVQIERLIEEGSRVKHGDLAIRLQGPTRSLLSGERLALNFLQRLSGVATQTAAFVEASGGRIAICDTRKTTPLWRDLEKYAVACGGGTNHRFGLFDMVMIKDTHADGAGGLAEALRRVAPLRPGLKVAAEARNMEEVQAALAADVDLLMLDNMSDDALAEAVVFVAGRVPIEITGGVTIETVGRLARFGVERVSIGGLTHSAQALDFSMGIELGE